MLINNDVVIDDPTDVANMMGKYFADLSSELNHDEAFLQREARLKRRLPDFSSENTEDYNRAFSLHELEHAMTQSGSTSVGPDKVHYEFLRHLEEAQVQELLAFYNYIWTHNVFPEAWRHSYVIPILKPGKDRNKVTSYRPIQLTSCLCKVYESMIAKRLSWTLEKYELLSKYQCAFRKGRSTTDHLVRIESHVREGFLHHCSTLAVFLDLKSAYNTVSPTVLLSRMYQIGFRGHLMSFVCEYLRDRTFQVRCGVLSNVFEQQYGLVQGGVISPLLFNIAIDSFADSIPRELCHAIYADDCTIWIQGQNVQNLFDDVQQTLTLITKWSKEQGFTFSAPKTTAILFRQGLRHIDESHLPTLMLGNERINKTNCVKYLGVMLDDKLNLKTHVDYVKSRAIRRLSILKCIAGKGNGADRTILIRIYKSLIRPILEYAHC